MDRRGFLKRLGAVLGLAPLVSLAKFFSAKPDLRQIGFSIKEDLGFLVFNPIAIQPITAAPKYVFTMFELHSCPTISIADIKNRRFNVEEQCILTQQKFAI